MRVFYPDDDFQDQAVHILNFSVKVLDHFADLFDVSYPLPKLGNI